MAEKDLCPCGSGKVYGECCEPVIKGTKAAPTAESLMRARYTSYVKHEIEFIINSCDEGDKIAEIDRKATEEWSKTSIWHGLKILNTQKGGESDDEGLVEFEATYTDKNNLHEVHHENAYFKKVNGKWLYEAGDVKPMTVVREGKKVGRNDPCPCGSGKKYKKCCGR